MRPGRILHPELAKALATCGHTDIILVTDAGFPIPKDANRIDLGYYAGQADLLDILRMLRKEIFVEEVAFAPEVKTHHPALYKDLRKFILDQVQYLREFRMKNSLLRLHRRRK